MWKTTGWCLLMWVKITIALALGVLGVGLVGGWHRPSFAIAIIAALLIEWLTMRQLVREWRNESRYTWWGQQ